MPFLKFNQRKKKKKRRKGGIIFAEEKPVLSTSNVFLSLSTNSKSQTIEIDEYGKHLLSVA